MDVVKRSGKLEKIKFDKITARISKLQKQRKLDKDLIDPVKISQQVILELYDGIKTSDIDTLIAEHCHYSSTIHPDFDKLAVAITASRLHKECPSTFLDAMELLRENKDKYGNPAPLVSEQVVELARKYSSEISSVINPEADYEYTFMGLRTLMNSYLLKSNNAIVETPQYMNMRNALGVHGDNISKVFETYMNSSEKYYTHATPTLYNSGTERQQDSSCFLMKVDDDLSSIFHKISNAAKISKHGGGIGVDISDIRSTGAYIRGTGGKGNGIIPMLKVWNETMKYVDQSGKRKGSAAIYLSPTHPDFPKFIDIKRNHGAEEDRARDLFPAAWVPDLLMERAERDEMWSFFCPDEAPGLNDVYDEKDKKEFTDLYERYESEGRAKGSIKARELLERIAVAQIESGTPYMLYKDHANRKSNQKNIGVIRQSNLCTEIMEYTDSHEEAVCNLASISLPAYWNEDKKELDHELLVSKTRKLVQSLNDVIDVNYYPTEETRFSNLRHRPIGIGYQGLADLFFLADLAFDSEEARKMNREFAESIYYGAVLESMELAKIHGPYSTFDGSPASQGILQFDMWDNVQFSGRYDWDSLKKDVMRYGMRNSLLIAPMPTASTSHILGNYECFEPVTNNMYSRNILSGNYMVINKHMVRDLISLGLWSDEMSRRIMANKGSIYSEELFPEIPERIRIKYRTVWEISQKSIIEMAADRGPFICQSQSMNLHVVNATTSKLTSIMMYAWKKGLKTGSYYIRTKAAVDAISFTVDPASKITSENTTLETEEKELTLEEQALFCSLENPDACDFCSG